MGQDVAELLGLCGILPIHPSTNLRLKKLHETRKNMLHKNADSLGGHENAMDAAFDIIQNLDRQERIDAEGFDVFYYGEGVFLLYCNMVNYLILFFIQRNGRSMTKKLLKFAKNVKLKEKSLNKK